MLYIIHFSTITRVCFTEEEMNAVIRVFPIAPTSIEVKRVF